MSKCCRIAPAARGASNSAFWAGTAIFQRSRRRGRRPIMSADLRHLYLAHLSRECNKPELAHYVMAEQLHQIGATHVHLQTAAQDVPCATLSL